MGSVRSECIIVFISVCVIFDVIAQNRNNERCGIHTSKNQYPWLAAIEFQIPNMLKILCSGILVNNKHVISNKLSLDFFGGPKSVRLGGGGNCTNNQCTGDGGISYEIKTVIPHPDHDNSINSPHNIALIILRSTVPYTDAIRPICLPSADITRLADHHLYLTGITFSLLKLKVDLPMTYVDSEQCTSFSSLKAQYIFCAKNAEDTKLCTMPGGGLMNKRGEIYELVGLIDESYCNNKKVFINVFLYLDWIRTGLPELKFVYRNGDDKAQDKPSVAISDKSSVAISEKGCGRRKVDHVELIVNGESTKAGDWPWHVAIYRIDKANFRYICGGTLISKTTILTAAHCATISGVPVNPEILSVILGKYNLFGGDLNSQERQVHAVITHEDFAPLNHLENDIALLKLRSQATYNDYVQPACIWSDEAYDRLPSNRDYGTVVGWGIDQTDVLSTQLRQAYMPKVSDTKCIRRNPIFYANVLNNDKKFCAGWANGTSACNGDSGGGFLVFVPDTAEDNSNDAMGSWYIRGIVSLSAALRDKARCDPTQYVVFTDVDKYNGWIKKNLES